MLRVKSKQNLHRYAIKASSLNFRQVQVTDFKEDPPIYIYISMLIYTKILVYQSGSGDLFIFCHGVCVSAGVKGRLSKIFTMQPSAMLLVQMKWTEHPGLRMQR